MCSKYVLRHMHVKKMKVMHNQKNYGNSESIVLGVNNNKDLNQCQLDYIYLWGKNVVIFPSNFFFAEGGNKLLC